MGRVSPWIAGTAGVWLLLIALAAQAADGPSTDSVRLSATNSMAIVRQAYLDILKREPDRVGMQAALSQLAAGHDESWLRRALVESREGRQIAECRKHHEKKIKLVRVIPGITLLGIASLLAFARDKRIAFYRLAAVLLSLVLAGVLMELALRLLESVQKARNRTAWENVGKYRPAPDASVTLGGMVRRSANPRIVFELIPDISVHFMKRKVTTDSSGFRVTPCSSPDTNAYCIIGLGDSVMFGWGVKDEDTYINGLCSRLTEQIPSRPWRLINMAVPGYNSVMELETLKVNGLPLKPSLVMVHYLSNDQELPYFITVQDKSGRGNMSYLLSALSDAWRDEPPPDRDFGLTRTSGSGSTNYDYMTGIRAVQGAVTEMCSLASRNNFRLVFIMGSEPPDYLRDIVQGPNVYVFNYRPAIGAYCERERLSKEQAGRVLSVAPRDPHFSPIAHQVVAEALFKFISPLVESEPSKP